MKGNTGVMILGSSYHVLGQIFRPKNSEESPYSWCSSLQGEVTAQLLVLRAEEALWGYFSMC